MTPDWFEVLGQIVDPLLLLDAEGGVVAASSGAVGALGRPPTGKLSSLAADPAALDAKIAEAARTRGFVRGAFALQANPDRRFAFLARQEGVSQVLFSFHPVSERGYVERMSTGLEGLLEVEMKRLSAIERLSTAASHAATVEEIAGIALSELVLSAGCLGAELYVADERGLPLLRGSSGPTGREVTGDATPDPASLLMRALGSGKPMWMLLPEGGSEGAIPLFSSRRLIGGLALTFGHQRVHDSSVERFVTTIAGHLGPALERALLLTSERRARERAEEAERRKDELLAMLGQELRRPLVEMRASLEMMAMGGARERHGKELRVLEDEQQRLSQIVDHVLDLSSLTRGALQLRRQRVEVGQLVAKALELSGQAIERKGHRLVVDVPPGLWIEADPPRMAQVFAELLGNAAKFTPEKGKISVSAAQDGERISIAVRDTGAGVPLAVQERLFQDLLSGAGTLGLGLWIVRRVVGLHGGEVSVKSDGHGHGSTFVVHLSAAAPAASERVAEPRAPEPPKQSHRILVVDDDDLTAHVLSLALEEEGYTVRSARDGPTALRAAEEFSPDLAVLDIALPGMDGYELAERLRRTPSLQGVKIVGLSGYGHDLDRARALRAGFHAYLVKPIEHGRLLRTLAAVLSEAAA